MHSHSDHLTALLKAAKEFGLYKVVIHPFLDGRDTPPQSTADYMEGLENTLIELGIGFIGTVSGRYYAMDRDHNSEH